MVIFGKIFELFKYFYCVYVVNMCDLGFFVYVLGWFESVFVVYDENCIVSVVYKGDMFVGVGLVIINGNNVFILWVLILCEFNKLVLNMLFYWLLFVYCVDLGIDIFDFGCFFFEEGIYKFKK